MARGAFSRAGVGDADVEDAVQETLLAIHLKRHTWDPEQPLAPWVYAIARHKVVDALRRRGRRRADQGRMEEAISRAEHRYTNVFRAMAVSFWELDFTAVGGMVEQLRREGETELAAYLAANPEFVRKLIRATQVIDVNDLSVSMFGRGDKKEMLAGLEPYWPEASFPVYAAAVVAAVEGKPHFAAETRLSSIDGREYDVWFTACFPPEMLARGKLLIGILDISADKRAKAALEMSEQRYRSLFHVLPVAMLQVDRRELADVFTTLHRDGVRDLKAYFQEHPGFYEYAATRSALAKKSGLGQIAKRKSGRTSKAVGEAGS